ncbi:MAG: zinc-ribbon domain-containing protein [Planctomycetota bacterium]
MPLVQCPQCGTTYKITLEKLGGEVRCRHCQAVFTAEVKRSGPRSKTPAAPMRLILYGAIAAAVIMFAILSLLRRGGQESESNPTPPAEATSEPVPSPALTSPPPSPSSARKAMVEPVIRAFLSAVERRDVQELLQMLNFASFWRRDPAAMSGQQTWADLAEWQQTLKRQEYVDQLLAPKDEAALFVDKAAVDELEVLEQEGDTWLVRVKLRDPLSTLCQERRIGLQQSSGRWYLTSHDADPVRDPLVEERARLDEERRKEQEARGIVAGRRQSDEAPVELQEEVEGTPSGTKATVDQAVRALLDLSKTADATAARRQLVDAGKPAIVALLNALVPLDLEDRDELLQANRAIQVLQEMTGESFDFSAMGVDGHLDQEAKETNERALRQWFGWWRDNKLAWKPPEKPEDEEEPARRGRTRR